MLAEVNNAKDIKGKTRQQLLLVGPTGSGKTTALRSLIGKKFVYAFDPNSLDALKGSDIDYLEFCPDITDLNLSVTTLKKGVADPNRRKKKAEPMTYRNWEADFEERIEEGFFKDYAWVGFDSYTTFQDIIMDRVMFLNGRLGKHPEQADWTSQMNTTRNIFRVANSTCNVFCACHTELFRDELTGKIHGRILMTGRNRTRIPLMFSQIFATKADVDADGKKAYSIQTIPDRENPSCRTSIQGLQAFEDVTIDMSKALEGQGIGAIMQKTMVTA